MKIKKITSWSDIQYIIDNKLDVKDFRGHIIPFVSFLRYSVLDIIGIFHQGDYTYDILY